MLARDTFIRADSSGLGANWTTPPYIAAGLGIIGNKASNENAGVSAAISIWSAQTFGNDQVSQATMAVKPTTDAQVIVRASAGGSGSFYAAGLRFAISTLVYSIWKAVNGPTTALGSSTVAVTAGDVLTLMAVGSLLTLLVNGQVALQVTDTSLTSGAPGLRANSTSNIGIFTNWSGGDAYYSVPDCRDYGNFPNDAVLTNGTSIYTTPAVDSRVAGAPVDSRVSKPVASGTYPQNSRAPGEFGPGE